MVLHDVLEHLECLFLVLALALRFTGQVARRQGVAGGRVEAVEAARAPDVRSRLAVEQTSFLLEV